MLKIQNKLFMLNLSISTLLLIGALLLDRLYLSKNHYEESVRQLELHQSLSKGSLNFLKFITNVLFLPNQAYAFIFMFFHKNKRRAYMVLMVIFLNFNIRNLLAIIFHEGRPFHFNQQISDLINQCNNIYGHPSGHSSGYTSLYFFFLFSFY